MFTNVRDPKQQESFGLRDKQDRENTTVIEVYLEDSDLATVEENAMLAFPDPTTHDTVIVASELDIDVKREGGVSATPQFGLNEVLRVREGDTPVRYPTTHVDGAGDSTYGTVLLFYHADDAAKPPYLY